MFHHDDSALWFFVSLWDNYHPWWGQTGTKTGQKTGQKKAKKGLKKDRKRDNTWNK